MDSNYGTMGIQFLHITYAAIAIAQIAYVSWLAYRWSRTTKGR